MANPSGRNRERRSGRRVPFREPKPKMLVVCEGANTEKEYFEQFAKFQRNSLVDITVEGGKGVPLTVVHAAKARKEKAISDAKRKDDEFLKYQSVWCVFDVDDHPNVSEAKILAADNGIEARHLQPLLRTLAPAASQGLPGGTASAQGSNDAEKTRRGLRQTCQLRRLQGRLSDSRPASQIPRPTRRKHGGARQKPHQRRVRADGNDQLAVGLACFLAPT